MPKIYVTQQDTEGTTTNGQIFSIDGTTWWASNPGGTEVATGQAFKLFVEDDVGSGVDTYFWRWSDGHKGYHRTITMGSTDMTITAITNTYKMPVNKVVLGEQDGSYQRIVMDISDSTITGDNLPERTFNAVQEGITYYDNKGMLQTGTNPCVNIVNVQTTPPLEGTPDYIFTIVTQQ